MANAFSDRSMRAQEPIFRYYVDLLIQRLAEISDNGKARVDMKAWINYTTFDAIGNLGFGSDFGCLDNSRTHPWVSAITANLKDSALMPIALQLMSPACVYLLGKSGFFNGLMEHMKYSKEKVLSRMEMKVERPDFLEGLLKKGDTIVSPGTHAARVKEK